MRAHFAAAESFLVAMAALAVEYEPMSPAAAELAGGVWRSYCAAVPRARERRHLVADCLIGAHALAQADALLTRDRGFYRTQFEGLSVVDPTPTPRRR